MQSRETTLGDPSGSEQERSEVVPREEVLVRFLTGLFFAALLFRLAQPLFSYTSWMVFLQDDCFYYLKVAQNIAHGHGSSFNGVAPTNGYQPLWLWILTALSLFTENPRAILGFFALSNFLAAIATFLLSWRLLRVSALRPLLLFTFAALVTLYSVTLFVYGMETTLTVPLMLGVTFLLSRIRWLAESTWRAFGLGLLVSAMVLSRIDTIIFAGLAACFLLASRELRALIRTPLLLGAGAGLLPLPAYFISNHIFFRTWLPVSGMAKQLRHSHAPSLEPWRVFFHPLACGYLVIVLAAMLVLPAVRRRLPLATWIYPAVLLFPFVYYFILSCVSDWTLWGWYMYPIRTALCISLVIFCLWPPSARWLRQTWVVALLVLAVAAGAATLRWRRQQEDIDAASIELEHFAETHPGTYAMGDRAGRVGYRLHDPVIQTEGLMMDRAFLAHVAASEPLRSTLAQYGVRYYVGTAYVPFSGCFHADEPAKAGPTSAHMSAEFCEAPLATWFHNGIETLVFELK